MSLQCRLQMGGRGVEQLWAERVSMYDQQTVKAAKWNPVNQDCAAAISDSSCTVALYDLTQCQVVCLT